MKSLLKKILMLTVFVNFAMLTASQAQTRERATSFFKKTYFNIDWQLNAPFSNELADKISGWGASFEGGYKITPHFSAGLFLSFHTNNTYVPRTVLTNATTDYSIAFSTDQHHSLYQLPFGAAFRYSLNDGGILEPYIGLKAGAEYSKGESYIGSYVIYNNTWGFHVSPELGLTVHPFRHSRFGFHVAVYYNYSTNDNSLLQYNANGLNNYGFRFGIAF